MKPAEFEHIAIALRVEDLASWDRLLRGALGGEASLGGEVPKNDFQGGQIVYPNGGMLELLSWTTGSEKTAMKRYVDKHGGSAALHHLTFLVESFEAAVERSRALGYEPMIGRNTRTWKEFFLRDPGLRPAGMLIQVLQADKQALREDSGWDTDWAPFEARYAQDHAPVTIAGVQVASVDPEATERLFVELLGAEATRPSASVRELRWRGSSMRVLLLDSSAAADTYVLLAAADAEEARELGERVAAEGHPAPGASLLRPGIYVA